MALVVGLAFVLPNSTGFFFQRLAWLLAAVPLAQWLADRWEPRALLFAGRESLVLYAAHLLLIEALVLIMLPRAGFGIAGCVAIFTGVLAATCAIAIAWRKFRAP